MKKILIIGAGRSATSLIQYLLKQSEKLNWEVTVADMSLELAKKKIDGHPNGVATQLNAIEDVSNRQRFIEQADIVVSMLPPHLHMHVAKDCLLLGKHLATASYVSEDMGALHEEVAAHGLTFLSEMGLDPGIDHMSAMQIIDDIRDKGGKIDAFRSYAGGLVAPESDNNPWHYKFSWSPRNVVLAGQGIAKYLENNVQKYVTYNRLFAEHETIDVQGMGEYDAYPNRVSLKYTDSYKLHGTPTVLRATLRHQGYCRAWNLLVQLGLTDDSYDIDDSAGLTYRELVERYIPETITEGTTKEKVALFFNLPISDESIKKLEWLGIFEDTKIEMHEATPAQILQALLEEKWKLEPEDKDMIIMQHELDYTHEDTKYRHLSTLVYIGQDAYNTAMATLVGLPLAIGVKHILLGNIDVKGVHIPIIPSIYNPVMEELEEYGVKFVSKEVKL